MDFSWCKTQSIFYLLQHILFSQQLALSDVTTFWSLGFSPNFIYQWNVSSTKKIKNKWYKQINIKAKGLTVNSHSYPPVSSQKNISYSSPIKQWTRLEKQERIMFVTEAPMNSFSVASGKMKHKRKNHHKCRDNSCHRGSYESLPSFLWWYLDQWGSSKEKSKEVCSNVIDYNECCWKKKPAHNLTFFKKTVSKKNPTKHQKE